MAMIGSTGGGPYRESGAQPPPPPRPASRLAPWFRSANGLFGGLLGLAALATSAVAAVFVGVLYVLTRMGMSKAVYPLIRDLPWGSILLGWLVALVLIPVAMSLGVPRCSNCGGWSADVEGNCNKCGRPRLS